LSSRVLRFIPFAIGRRRRTRLVGAGIAVVACMLLASCAGDKVVLGTDPGPVDPAGARRHVIRVEGRAVECWVARSPGARSPGGRADAAGEPQAFVLFLVGKGTRADGWTTAVADAWGDKPVEVWGMNYPGFAGSDGPPRLERVGPTALGTYDVLKQTAGVRPVFLQAASFGTAPALHVAARRPVAGLVLHKPPPLKQMILGSYGWWNLWLLAGPVAARVPDDLDSLSNASRASAPAVFLLHGWDEIIAPHHQRRVAEAYAGPKRVIEMAARHDDPLTREASQQLAEALEWLWRANAGGR
jgi:hypothetical protein